MRRIHGALRAVYFATYLAISLAAVGLSVGAHAQQPNQQEAELKAAWEAARPVAQRGPTTVTLRDQGTMQLPEGYVFVPAKEAARIMRAMGNQSGPEFMGLIVTTRDDASWFVTVDFDDAGYIKDDDAKDWDADELLKNLKEGTEQGNQRREQMGIPPIQVTRWIERPTYESGTHRLVWSAEVKLKKGDDPDPTINYNTYVLGREGYISLDLVTNTSSIDTDKLDAKRLLGAVTFDDGKKYSDFNSSTDKVAAYGLAALIGGIAIKKLGLLAVIGAFLLKFAKLIMIGVVALGGTVTKFFKKKSGDGAGA